MKGARLRDRICRSISHVGRLPFKRPARRPISNAVSTAGIETTPNRDIE